MRSLVTFAPDDAQDQLQANVDEVGVHEPIDRDALQVIETVDDEGRLEIATDDQLYALLGIQD